MESREKASVIEISIMARTPELGLVKTRLARGVGDPEALRVYKELFHLTLAVVSRVCRGSDSLRPVLWYKGREPDEIDLRDFGGPVLPQPGEDLGANMDAAFDRIGRDDVDGVLVLGSDHPTLVGQHLVKMLNLLKKNRTVIGPVEDGGFWCFGSSVPVERLFFETDLKPGVGLASLLEVLAARGLEASRGPELWDLDTEDDLRRYEMSRLPRKS